MFKNYCLKRGKLHFSSPSFVTVCPDNSGRGKLFKVCNPKKCQNEKQKYNADTIGKPLAPRCKQGAATVY